MMLAAANQVQLAFFKGKSFSSRVIRWITWGPYSHVGILFPEWDMMVEAWNPGGVLMNKFGRRHTPGTEVDVYEFKDHPNPEQLRKGIDYLYSQMGKGYDYAGVTRFLTRRERTSDEKLFCSELVSEFCDAMDHKLLELPPFKCSPSALATSTLLKPYRTRITR